ncbi:hypothetical protein ACLOJK_000184 [Asimina triloba]
MSIFPTSLLLRPPSARLRSADRSYLKERQRGRESHSALTAQRLPRLRSDGGIFPILSGDHNSVSSIPKHPVLTDRNVVADDRTSAPKNHSKASSPHRRSVTILTV